MALVLDAMGSDAYPDPEVQAAVEASLLLKEEIILVGNQEILSPKLKSANTSGARVRIHHAPDVVEMTDKAVDGTKKKALNSMKVGMELVATGEGKAFVTAGNTGAAMFNALLTLKRMKGVMRPALTALFPTRTGKCVVLDIGANADCRPEFLCQFAIMGSLYAEKLLNISKPRVALLSNGEEAGKGNTLIKETYPLMENLGINFIGNAEAKELFGGHCDVVVTDGFTGNVLLKASEAVAKLITEVLKENILASLRTKIGGLLIKPVVKSLKRMMDPSSVGAAPLLGIDGLVFVGHGRSDVQALVNALSLADHAVKINLLDDMRTAIQERFVPVSNNP
jgi:glycerol-3-phosphate acyltransferase PlsX